MAEECRRRGPGRKREQAENTSMTTTDLEQQSPRQAEVHGPAAPPPPSSTRRVAFVGTGYIADWHGKVLKLVKNIELVAVCDQSMQRAQAFADQFGVPHAYDSLQSMLNEEKLE